MEYFEILYLEKECKEIIIEIKDYPNLWDTFYPTEVSKSLKTKELENTINILQDLKLPYLN